MHFDRIERSFKQLHSVTVWRKWESVDENTWLENFSGLEQTNVRRIHQLEREREK